MRFISTRGGVEPKTFEDVILTGLAPDGGLFVPEQLPQFSQQEIASWAGLSYQDLALKVMTPFVDGAIPPQDLKKLIDDSYSTFRHSGIAPLVQTGHNEWIMELFHGPTLAFKDFALQFLGNLLDYTLEKRNQKVVIMGATSGDTGAAVTEACAGVPGVRAVVLYPRIGVSGVQESQIARARPGVVALSVDGTFDDCQAMVKRALADESLRRHRPLLTANSINPVRLIAQVPFAFHAKRLLDPGRRMGIVVPSGNLGNVGAVQLARRMGLDVAALVAATNTNSPLPDLFATGEYRSRRATPTASNAMDIGDPNNLSRLLAWREGGPSVEAVTVDDRATLDAMRRVRDASGYVLCPHSAVGWKAAEDLLARDGDKLDEVVVFGTAHPAKFPDVLQDAFGDANASRFPGDLPAPAPLKIGNDFEAVRKVLESEAGFGG